MEIPPLKDAHEGREGEIGKLIRAELRREATPEEAMRFYWEVSALLEKRSTARPLRAPRVSLALAALAAAAVLVVTARPEAPSDAPAVAAVASESSDLSDQRCPGGWCLTELPAVGRLERDSREELSVAAVGDERQVRLDSGVLRAEIAPQAPGRPVVVVTPHVRIVVLGTRFDVAVEDDETFVELLHGQIRVESPYGAVVLESGQAIRSSAPRLRPTVETMPVEPATPIASARRFEPEEKAATSVNECDGIDSREVRRACLEQVAKGKGLAAQNALYLLATEERGRWKDDAAALEAIHQYEARFPDGMMAREVALRKLEIYRRHGKLSEAIAAADRYEKCFGEDPRVEAMMAVRAAMIGEREGCSGSVRALIARLGDSGDERIRKSVERLREMCERKTEGE